MSQITRGTLFFAVLAVLVSALSVAATAQRHITGTLSDGATYVIDVPASWNGTLLLYSHGYVAPGGQNPAIDVSDPLTGGYLLAAGFALAGSSYASTGWAVQEAVPDQIATLGVFQTDVGTPTVTIAWGHSLGGMITAALVQEYPTSFNAALPMCGVVGGGVGTWNEGLDGEFAFNTLVAGGALEVVDIGNAYANLAAAEVFLAAAQATPEGQARIALTAALADTPGWYDPTSPEPASTDYTDREANQYLWLQNVDFPFVFDFRAELESRAGGNPSFNNGVNYLKQLIKSVDYDEVVALYSAAGLDLKTDLNTLASTPRITADQGALTYLKDYVIYNGQITVPVLTMHTTGDGLVPVQEEQAYSLVATKAKDQKLLKEIFVHRAGHCEFSPAEMLTALSTLLLRLNSGKWKNLSPTTLNNEASALGATYNVIDVNGQVVPASPAFETYKPAKFLRPYDAFTK